jgi:hypothetical protein
MAILSEVNGYGLAAAKPAGATEGYLYYETDSLLLKRYNGTTWDTMTTVITPTGAPAKPWWDDHNFYPHIDCFAGGTVFTTRGARYLPLTISGTVDSWVTPADRVMLIANKGIDTTPAANTMVGFTANQATYPPWNDYNLMKESNWYTAIRCAVRGRTDLDHEWVLTQIQPNKVGVLGGFYSTEGTSSGAGMGFQVLAATANWQIVGTHWDGAVMQRTIKDSGVACVADRAYVLEMAYEAGLNTLNFYIDGDYVGQLDFTTDNGPLNSGNVAATKSLNSYWGCIPHSTTPASSANVELAWWKCYHMADADNNQGYQGSW